MRHFVLRFSVLLLTSAVVLQLCACGGAAGVRNSVVGTLTTGPTAAGAPSFPRFANVVVVLEENHSYSQVIGNSAMPFLNQLATANSVAKQYDANAHP